VVKVAGAAALCLVVVLLVPRTVSSGGDVPPVGMMLVTAVVISVVCAAMLFWGIRSDLGLPLKVAVYAVAFNVIVIVVKFVLAPRGFYEVNQLHTLDGWISIDDPIMATLAAVLVFGLYAAAYVVLYRLFRSRLDHLEAHRPLPRVVTRRRLVWAIVIGVLVLVSGGGALVLLVIPLGAGFEYLDFVFSSTLSLLIALALAGATGLASLAFHSASKRATVVGDAALFMGFFWLGLFFLALYHVLWVVYVLVLTSIWPLKVVTPK
jgi:hypothetical protein